MRLFRRLLSFALLAALTALPMLGCTRASEMDTTDRFFSCLENAEYPRIYQLLTAGARKRISLVELSERYDEIYREIGVQKIVCKQTGVADGENGSKAVAFQMTVTADKLGEFTLDMALPLREEDGHWRVEWTSELILPELGEGDRVSLITNPARRGEIFDVNGELLAKNDYALSVCVNTGEVSDFETTIRLLAPMLGMTEADVRKKLERDIEAAREASGMAGEPDDTVPPEAAGISLTAPSATGATASPSATPSPAPSVSASPGATAAAGATEPKSITRVIKAYPRDALTQEQKDALLEIPGVVLDDYYATKIRTYPYGSLLSQTLGFTRIVTAEDLADPENADLTKDSLVGKLGLEKAYDRQMRGKPGYDLVILDAGGNRKLTLAHKAGADGQDLRLTIDIKLQQRAEMLLREYMTEQMSGSVVVMDPKTGYIQALASLPTFDPNVYSFSLDSDTLQYLSDPVKTPLINRATSGLYPPGSTFKPFTASMGLSDSVINANFVFSETITDDKWTPSDNRWIYPPIKRYETTPAPLNLKNAIIHSDNIFFAYTAMKIGAAKFYQHCLDLGWTAEMEFDLTLATSRISNTGKIDNLGQLADSGYGQGELLITPVQMAALFGSLANGGDIMVPRIIERICHTEGPRYIADTTNPPEVWREDVVPDYNLRILLPHLKQVAQVGTAKDLNRYKNLKDFEICAKTGTAETNVVNGVEREIAWLIGFTTKEMDRLVCVSIDVPEGEGRIRTEIAKRMFHEEEKAGEEGEQGEGEENGDEED